MSRLFAGAGAGAGATHLKSASHLMMMILISGTFAFSQSEVPPDSVVAEEPRNGAVILDFQGVGITSLEAMTLTMRLAGELANTGAVSLLDRESAETALSERGLSLSECFTPECAVSAGKAAGTPEVIIGSFEKTGDVYRIFAQLVSVADGTVEREVDKPYRGEVDGLVTQVELTAWELMGLEAPDALKQKAGIPLEKPKVAKAGNRKWYLLAGLVAVAGAGAAIALSGGEEKPTGSNDLKLPPDPPIRPKFGWRGGR